MGTFSLTGLPPGKYTITAWHERYGDQSPGSDHFRQRNQAVNFVFKAKPY